MLIGLLIFAGVSVMFGGIAWGVIKLIGYVWAQDKNKHSRSGATDATPPKFPNLISPVIVFLFGLLWMLGVSTGSTHVDGTDVAVVENTITGQFSTIGPGTHIFPAQAKLIPFVTRVTKYTLRRQIVEVGKQVDGAEFDKNKAVAADSNSPGRPAVYFWTRVWAYPNPDMIVELHKRYGPDYLHNWIERVYIAALKSVQGKSEYYYVGQDRVGFQHAVEEVLQSQLLNGDGESIVYVQQLAVVNFEFSPETNAFLQSVQKVEFDRQQAEQQIQVNKKKQEGDKIAADTSYIVETRNAERDRDAQVARATGGAQAVKIAADAEAYRISQTYTAEAEGIKKVQTVLADAPEGYLEYQKTKQWDGKLPKYILGDGAVPFFDLTDNKDDDKDK